jgi:hypothetical protein
VASGEMHLEKARAETYAFILRERLGWLRTMSQYVPPVLRKKYLGALEDVREVASGER